MTLLAIDEGRQRLHLVDTADARAGWQRDLGDFPLARDLQRLGRDRALVGFERGFIEIDIASGAVLRTCDRWSGVTAARRLPDGRTLVTGMNLDGGTEGINVVTLDSDLREIESVRRDGDYVRGMRPAGDGYLLCTNDHILETDAMLRPLRKLVAPGFEHAWKAERLPGGDTLVSAGYGAFMARFDAEGVLVHTFGGAAEVPEAVAPFFYATFQVLDDGRIVVANWQDHGPDNGAKGRQLLVFGADGALLDTWSDAERISSLQGILVL
ncbi:hypothetical protein [Pseudoduganella lutea]|uniref:Uncharacterized protein n=1 Tax=Pseudoduganella lutea TaxID=321985 RepID=A0A4P6KRQ6_9BURK|nr:hypothetical protein [Pseudoduganella lutea]QBE61781.1 hypothetical protein EWM63_01215 [Pseudoduganella lutea]